MKKTLIFTIAFVVSVLMFVGFQEAESITFNKDYVMYSDSIFIVFEAINSEELKIIDGGILYGDQFVYFDLETIQILDTQNNVNKAWVIGALESGDRFYFTWIIGNSNPGIGVWILDNGEIIKIKEDVIVSKLFY